RCFGNKADLESVSSTFHPAVFKAPAAVEFDVGVIGQRPAIISTAPCAAILIIDAARGAGVVVEIAVAVVSGHVARQSAGITMVVRVAVGNSDIAAMRPESRTMGGMGCAVLEGVIVAFGFKGIT
ncbi:hypothetical protein EG867_16865, partial [Enterococcus faecalis]